MLKEPGLKRQKKLHIQYHLSEEFAMLSIFVNYSDS